MMLICHPAEELTQTPVMISQLMWSQSNRGRGRGPVLGPVGEDQETDQDCNQIYTTPVHGQRTTGLNYY